MKAFTILLFCLAASGAQAASFKTLYDFQGFQTGSDPIAGVTKVGASVCGTTTFGASYGNVYCIDRTTGAETVLYSFQDGLDGATPSGGLLHYKGKLYGTTTSGGQGAGAGYGTVFSIDLKTGAFKTLYAFTNGADGGTPSASLIEVNGLLYSTAMTGGTDNLGTVFSIDPRSGKETTLFQFTPQNGAAQPTTALIAVGNVLYGTADGGNFSQGGLLYSIDLSSGTETDVSIITEGPNASPAYFDGALWGTTAVGGAAGYGAIYRTDPTTGATTYVYGFLPFVTGAYPAAALTVRNGMFYTTTSSGGANGVGTVIRFDPATSKAKVLYAFTNGNDGANPQSGLTDIDAVLYGTTFAGAGGNGTVFSIGR